MKDEDENEFLLRIFPRKTLQSLTFLSLSLCNKLPKMEDFTFLLAEERQISVQITLRNLFPRQIIRITVLYKLHL